MTLGIFSSLSSTLLFMAICLWIVLIILALAMRVYVRSRRTILHKTIEDWLEECEVETKTRPMQRLPRVSTVSTEKEPPGKVTLELDLTREE